jgi:hypothetical protein
MELTNFYTYIIKNIDITPKKVNLLLRNSFKSKKSLNFSKIIKELIHAQNNAVISLKCEKKDISIFSVSIHKGKTYTKQIAGFKGNPQIRQKIKSLIVVKFKKK